MNIDVHAHYIPSGSLKAASDVARSHGLKLEKDERNRDMLTRDDRPLLTQPKGEFSDLDLRLSIMDHQGVEMQALAPASSYFFYWMPAANGLEYARWLNDRFAEAVAKYPRRFVGLASVPMQDGALAAVGSTASAPTMCSLATTIRTTWAIPSRSGRCALPASITSK